MDFARYNQWQPGWKIQSIDSSKSPTELKAGDRLNVSMNGNVHHPTVVVRICDPLAPDIRD